MGSGLFQKAEDAEIRTRASSAEEQVNLWKNENLMAEYSKEEKVSSEAMLKKLKAQKLVYEEEIYRDEEIIRIKAKDGTIVKEISYAESSKLKINISKTPETEKAETVLLEITSIEGPGVYGTFTEEELDKEIERLQDKEVEKYIKLLIIEIVNRNTNTKITKFEDILQIYYEGGAIEEPTEECFWKLIEKEGMSKREFLKYELIMLKKDEESGKIFFSSYEIYNDEGKLSNSYIATKNGTYTFTIKDINSEKTYIEKVEVDNIYGKDSYFVEVYNMNDYKARDMESPWIRLMNRETMQVTNYDELYIIYNGNRINVTKWYEENKYCDPNMVETREVNRYLYDNGLLGEKEKFENGEECEFIFVKNSYEYHGIGVMDAYYI